MNQELIKKLAAGEIAVKNDGTLEQLEQVLRAAFPDDINVPGSHYMYYQKFYVDEELWDCVDHTTLPSHSISDFYTEDQPEFVRGEVVEVRDGDGDDTWVKRIYLCTIDGAVHPFVCVSHAHKERFLLNQPFLITGWTQIRKLQPKHIEVTREEIAAWKGCKPEQIVIV